jgi:S1-C subfamily serine protease
VQDTVTLDVQRGERRFSVRVPVGERNPEISRLAELVAQQSPIRSLGIFGLTLSPPIAELLPSLRRKTGVVVAAVSAAIPFSHQGRLEAGDVIYSLNGKTVDTVNELNTVAAALKPGTAAVVQLERDGVLMFMAFRVEH